MSNPYYWIIDLSIPLAMFALGTFFVVRPPKKINSWMGFRTVTSMKSQANWNFANNSAGKHWRRWSLMLSGIIIVSKLIIPIDEETLSLIHMGLSIMVMMAVVPVVEKELKLRNLKKTKR